MTIRRKTRFVLLSLLGVGLMAPLGYSAFRWVKWRERPDAATSMAVELRPLRQVIKTGQIPELSVSLVNHGDLEVLLVEPGDGSQWGMRTPLIEWSHEPWFRGGRCGNINALGADDVFTLRPGERRPLGAWVGVPRLPGPGSYRVAVRYTNIPDHPWRGVPLRDHDPVAMKRVKESAEVLAVSNSVEIVVED